jgi:hypothetical protein
MTTMVSAEVVAEKLSVTPRAVRAWLDAGILRGAKIGRIWRVDLKDLEAFVEARTNQPKNVVTLARGGSR